MRTFSKNLKKQSVRNQEKAARLSKNNKQLYPATIFDAVSRAFRCPTCDTSSVKKGKLQRILTRCSEQSKNVYPKRSMKH